jgi:hypothetical protein
MRRYFAGKESSEQSSAKQMQGCSIISVGSPERLEEVIKENCFGL